MNLSELCQSFVRRVGQRTLNIAIVGDAMLDEYFEVGVDRIAPEAPIPVLRSDYRAPKVCPGGAANVAHQMDHLGVIPWLIAPLDYDARIVLTGLNLSHCVACWWDIPRKRRYVSDGQLLVRHDIESPHRSDADMAKVRDRMAERFHDLLESRRLDAVILSDYAKGALDRTLIRDVINSCRNWSIPVLVDPKSRPLEEWEGCTVLKLNGDEAKAAGNHDGHAVRSELGCHAVVITRASEPPTVCLPHGTFVAESGPAVGSPCNVSGAGDCFLAWLAVAFCHGFNGIEAASLAHLAGKHYVAGSKNEPVHPANLLYGTDQIGFKLFPLDYARRSETEGKVVFTNGCFDLLHAGHVRMLQWAKKQGDWLVVGINSDSSVRRLKGDGRPVVDQASRAHLLASLSCVDSVIVFDEDTPQNLINRVQPDILVKGYDYADKSVIGAEKVKLRIAPEFGTSHTSDLLQKIKERA